MRRNVLVRNVLVRSALAVVAVFTLAFSATAVAHAQPLRPGTTPVVGLADGVGYSIDVSGRTISYTVTDVPRISRLVPGFCTSAVIDAVKAAPIIGPDIIALVQGQSVNVVALLAALRDADAITATHLGRFANGDGVVTGTFEDIPDGLYAVMSVCNLDPDLYGLTGAFVLGDGLDYGSSA